MTELLLGCGRDRTKRIIANGVKNWKDLVTLDCNPDHKPDILWDLERFPYPLASDFYDEIHAYEVLEHTGRQGDYHFFFRQFSELWRIMKPGGLLVATVPSYKSMWAWGDPSHTRVLTSGSLTFLSQLEYKKGVGHTTMSDFRHLYKADFEPWSVVEDSNTFLFVLAAIKPARL